MLFSKEDLKKYNSDLKQVWRVVITIFRVLHFLIYFSFGWFVFSKDIEQVE